MWDEAVDHAIDDVAREMTVGEPYGDLRARVMDRLRHGSGGHARWRHVWASAMATAAIVLFALVAYRETRPTSSPTAISTPAPVGPGDLAVLGPGADGRGERPVGPGKPAAAGPKGRVLRTIPPSPIDALMPTPIDIAPMAFDDLDTDSLAVQPLDTIAPIAVAPLGQGDRP